MSDQEHLFKPPKPVAPLRPLTDRQRDLYALICSVPGGVEPIELGAMIHAGQGRHPVDEPCEFCPVDGSRVLKEKGIRTRVVRRPGGVYEPRDEADRARPEPTMPLELPGDSWEDIFDMGDAA